jgi:hypothetical protein
LNFIPARCSPVEDILKARLAGAAWPDHMPWFLLGIRTGPRKDLNISSAESAYGAPLELPGKFVGAREPTAAKFLEHLLFTPTTFPNQAASSLKVHKHEIFVFKFFCRNRNLMVPRVCNTRFLKIVFNSAEIFTF